MCHFPIVILGQMWYLIVSIPDLCTLTYCNTFVLLEINCKINTFGVLKSLILYINDVMERYYI